jgi:hypothetical protein
MNFPYYWLPADGWAVQILCCHICASSPAPVNSGITLSRDVFTEMAAGACSGHMYCDLDGSKRGWGEGGCKET